MEVISLNKFDVDAYNNLEDPGIATCIIDDNKEQFNQFLEEAKQITKNTPLQQFMGLRLLHKHFELSKNEVIADEESTFDNQYVIRAIKYDSENSQKTLYPASWIINKNGTLSIFEYSTDNSTQKKIDLINAHMDVFQQLLHLILAKKLEKVVSLAILGRQWHQNFDMQGKKFLEQSYFQPTQQSVLIPKDFEEIKADKNSIKTSWSLNADVPEDQCNETSYCNDIGGFPAQHSTVTTHSK